MSKEQAPKRVRLPSFTPFGSHGYTSYILSGQLCHLPTYAPGLLYQFNIDEDTHYNVIEVRNSRNGQVSICITHDSEPFARADYDDFDYSFLNKRRGKKGLS